MIENEDQLLDPSKLSELKVFDQILFKSECKNDSLITFNQLHLNIIRLSKFYLVNKLCEDTSYNRIICNLGHAQKIYKESIKDFRKSKETFIYDEVNTFDIQLLKNLLHNWKYRVFTKKNVLTKNEYCYEDAIIEYKKYFRFDPGIIREEKSKGTVLFNGEEFRKKRYCDSGQLKLNFD